MNRRPRLALACLGALLPPLPVAAQTAADVAAALARIDAAPRWSELAPLATEAQRLAEDKRFSDTTDGVSTITRQLVAQNAPPDRPTDRLAEIEAAAAIGAARPADRILDAWVGGLFLGRGCFGIDPAARAFLGKPAADLTAAEAAVLAALAKGPVPFLQQPEKLQDRAAFVLGQMQATGLAEGVTPADLPRIPDDAACAAP